MDGSQWHDPSLLDLAVLLLPLERERLESHGQQAACKGEEEEESVLEGGSRGLKAIKVERRKKSDVSSSHQILMMAMCLAVQVVTLFDVVLYHLFPFLKARNDDDESMIMQRALVRSFALQRVLKIKLKNERTGK